MNTNSELKTTNNKPNEKKDGYEKAARSRFQRIQKKLRVSLILFTRKFRTNRVKGETAVIAGRSQTPES
jgi:hypothetical protein